MVTDTLNTALKAAEKAGRLAEKAMEDQQKSQEEIEMQQILHEAGKLAHETLKAASKVEQNLVSKETWGSSDWGSNIKERSEEILC